MGVRGLPGADGGTAVAGQGVDLTSLLSGVDDNTRLNLVQFLMQLGQGQNSSGPLMDILGEQSKRAKMQADSLGPDVQYNPFLNPGGVFDSFANFIGSHGGVAPQLEPGARMLTHVPLDSLGSTFQDALNYAQQAARSQTNTAPPNAYGSQIMELLKPLFNRLGPSDTSGASAASRPQGDTTHYSAGGYGASGGPVTPAMQEPDSGQPTLGTSGSVIVDALLARMKAKRDEALWIGGGGQQLAPQGTQPDYSTGPSLPPRATGNGAW